MEIKETEAAILVQTGSQLELDVVQLPDELQFGQILVAMITSGICGAQLNEIDGTKGPDKFLPHLLGHEGFAQVIEIGPGVMKVKEGDFVILHWRPGSGIAAKPPRYTRKSKAVNAGWVTTFNRHSIVSENRVTRVDNASPAYQLPLLGCSLTTALGVVDREANLGRRDSLIITGFGGVGNAILQIAKLEGVPTVIVVDKHESKRSDALRLGASHFILSHDKKSAIKFLRELLPKHTYPSVAIETTGATEMIEFCYEATSEQGRIVLVGVPKLGSKARIYTLPLHFGKSITGSKGGGSIPDADIPFILNLFESEELNWDNFPVVKFNFSQINDAIGRMREGSVGRPILMF
jgi:S-(hydroxymethyl)glutathione dehydrogenase/alcohol dehydrogenase